MQVLILRRIDNGLLVGIIRSSFLNKLKILIYFTFRILSR